MKTMITIMAVALLFASSFALAVCLKGNSSIQEEYADSESVFIGKVIAVKNVPESNSYYDGDNYTVQVEEIFKGNPISPIIIFSESSSGRFPMQTGKTYIARSFTDPDAVNKALRSLLDSTKTTERLTKKSSGRRIAAH